MLAQKMKSISRIWKLPITQVVFVGCVLFTQPGMFDAITAIGAGGQKASLAWLTNQALAALYGCFAVVGFMGGSIVNTLGAKLTFFLGTIGYTLYIGSLWSLDKTGNTGFVVAGGALCGISAGMLWSVHGMVIMSYAEEKDKAKAFALTWSMLSIGAAIGGLIGLCQNLNTADTSGVATGTYVAFIAIMVVGCCVSLLLLNPQQVRRSDGRPLEHFRQTSFKREVIDTFKLLKEWRLVVLFPAFFASNFFYSYQFGINAFYFSLRTRALNSMVYWLTQILGTFGLGLILDNQRISRRKRGIIALIVTCVFVTATWIGGAIFQTQFDMHSTPPNVDWTSSKFGGPFVLYFMYGISDAMWQCWCYWIMGTLSNESYKLARCAGYYKAVQSAGSAISFGISSLSIPFVKQMGANFGMMLFSMPLMFIAAWKVNQTNYDKEEEVVPPADVQSQLEEEEPEVDLEKNSNAVEVHSTKS
ncbi:hypothetical protein PGUG_04601 [Meyerozyma guilliermondii ATCC 6260]|uniref:DUF895 domain membrane protein n=1 Tax=Meyerozyma guilliermondii (strain ATCC 6260 / CBS 566 / DSM 6381 / JCM 1539 / NBRC 10279 / NRRL Y-324) TaxID=294746 RepID=A5DMV0_PICGU|nr:uncharacterized protein PGUG_04601 [Meyerozyma guilliermondii ATCC 6260]EDK40503.2 hypothetical protein PGUG_04601 [Meyerozyma guilliermondii ATCC 6260]